MGLVAAEVVGVEGKNLVLYAGVRLCFLRNVVAHGPEHLVHPLEAAALVDDVDRIVCKRLLAISGEVLARYLLLHMLVWKLTAIVPLSGATRHLIRLYRRHCSWFGEIQASNGCPVIRIGLGPLVEPSRWLH